MIKRYLSLILLPLCLLLSCTEKQGPGETPEKETLEITRFTVRSAAGDIPGVISQEERTVMVSTPADFDIKKVTVDVEYTEGAVLKPESGYTYNFSKPVVFTLTKDGKAVSYTVTVGAEPEILSFEVPDYHIAGILENDAVTLSVPYGADITAVSPLVSVSAGCTLSPASGEVVDLTKTEKYTVTSPIGISKEYSINVTRLPQERQVRGVWVPDPLHTDVLLSYGKLKEFVDLLDELNFNAVYLGAWARELTVYRSKVLMENTNYASVEDGWMLKGVSYNGLTDDPVKDLITMAHEKGIKVFFWFEYGFMRSGGANPDIASHPILSVHPEWDGIGSDGKPSNYNNTDFYLNSYDPEVQDFIMDLIKEAIALYPDVDGVQGDDRLPAAPRNSGYNENIKALYKAETGKDVPSNCQDASWVAWRLSRLNAFGKRLYDEIKTIDPSLLVSFSPNPYPWCEQNLMQDWPSWIKGGYVDILSVQCYRDTEQAYKATLNEVMRYVTANTDKSLCNPGIYLRSGNEWGELFTKQMKYNREVGTNGESFFFNNGLKLEINKSVLKSFYTGKAVFPF